MCGNALRCAAKLVWERRGQLLPDWLWAAKNEDGKNDQNVLYIETPAGTRTAPHTHYRTRTATRALHIGLQEQWWLT